MDYSKLKELPIPLQDKLYLLGLHHQVVEPHQLPDDFIITYLQKGFITRDYVSDKLIIEITDNTITPSEEEVKIIRKYYQDRCFKQGWSGDNVTISKRLELLYSKYGYQPVDKVKKAIDTYFDTTSVKYIKKLENFILNVDPVTKNLSSTLISLIDGLCEDDNGA